MIPRDRKNAGARHDITCMHNLPDFKVSIVRASIQGGKTFKKTSPSSPAPKVNIPSFFLFNSVLIYPRGCLSSIQQD